MKRWLALLLCGACALSLAACGGAKTAPAAQGAQMVNPFVDYASLADAAADAGFTIAAPERILGYDAPLVQLVGGKMLQLTYKSGEDRLILRKAAGGDDISGDYNSYAETKTVRINGSDVKLRGADSKVSTATWCADGYSYALCSDVPLAADIMMDLIVEIA